jgi:hypothetical protein
MDLYAQNKDHFESKQMTIGSIEMVNSADEAHFIGTGSLNSTSATFLSLDFRIPLMRLAQYPTS